MFQQSQASLYDHVLQDRAWGDIDCATLCRHDNNCALEGHTTAQVHGTCDSQVVKLQHLGDGRDSLLEVGNLLEVTAQLDQRSIAETSSAHLELTVLEGVEIRLDQHQIGTGLDGQESSTRDVDSVGVVEVTDGSSDSGLELDNRDVGLALLVTRDGLSVGDNLHLQLVVLNHPLDGLEVQPDVVGVEVLELLDRLELVDVLLGDLGNLEESDRALVVDDGTTLDVSLGLVGQLHDVLGVGLHHVLQDSQVNNGSQVIDVGQEDDLNATLQELVEDSRVVERLENITVARGVPLGNGRVRVLGDWQKRVLVDSGVSRLVEGEDIDVVSLVFLDDGRGIVVGVERVHEDEGDIDIVGSVEEFNLSHGQVEERHAISDFDDGLGTDATHGGTETTVELQDGELVEELDGLSVGKVLIVDDLTLGGRGNAVPVAILVRRGFFSRHQGLKHTQHFPWPCRSGIVGTGQRSCRSRSRTTAKLEVSRSSSFLVFRNNLPSSARGP